MARRKDISSDLRGAGTVIHQSGIYKHERRIGFLGFLTWMIEYTSRKNVSQSSSSTVRKIIQYWKIVMAVANLLRSGFSSTLRSD